MKSRLQLLKTLKYILDEGSENSPVRESDRVCLERVIVLITLVPKTFSAC